jgi:hypothetical protein
VTDWTWTFTRGDQRLDVKRRETAGGMVLVVTEDTIPHSYFFPDVTALIRFQSDMEEFLLKTGWSFAEFSPEQRSGRDRRHFPRLSERRRWWTDGIQTLRRALHRR